MKIELNKGELTLKEGFTMEVKKSNPFFSDEGSYTFPATIPATPENLAILGNPERPTRSTRFIHRFPALIKGPFMQKRCTLLATGLSKSSGVNVSLLLDESEALSALKKRSMRKIFASKALLMGMSRSDPRSAQGFLWIACARASSGPGDAEARAMYPEIVAFPVVVKDGELYHFLNEVNSTNDGFVYQERNIPQKSDGSENVSVPEYYGITPFLRLSYVARAVFELSGYKVEQNDLETGSSSFLVLLNNCSDTYVSSDVYHIANYSDLVPDVTVGDFLTFLKDKFGMAVFVRAGQVQIRRREGCLLPNDEYKPDLDLTGHVIGEPEISFPEAKKLTVSVRTSLEGAAPIAETMEALKEENSTASGTLSLDSGTGTYTIYSNGTEPSLVKSGSDAFKFDRTIDGIDESEDISTEDEFVPMIRMPDGECYPFIGERINRHTHIVGNEESRKQSIMVCYARFYGDRLAGTTRSFTAPSFLYPNLPINFTVPALTPEGLYGFFYRRYGAMLMSASPEFRVKASLPLASVIDLRMDIPKYFMGTIVVITAMSYKIDDNGIRDLELSLRKIGSFTDEIRLSEIKIQTANLRWKLVNTVPSLSGASSVAFDGLPDYTEKDAPAWPPQYEGQITMRRERWVTVEYKRHSFLHWERVRYSRRYEEYFIGVER